MGIVKRIFLLIAAAFFGLSACAGTYVVRVQHIMPKNENEKTRYEALRDVYLLVNSLPVDAEYFAELVNRGVAEFGGSVGAFRAAKENPDSDLFVSELEPSSIAHAEFKNFKVVYKEYESEKKQTGSKGDTRVVKIKGTLYKASSEIYLKIYSYPSKTVLMEDSFGLSMEKKFESTPSDSLHAEMRGIIVKKAADRTVRLMAPVPVVRGRVVFKQKDQRDSVGAFKLAARGRWDEAEKIWKERLDSGSGSWKDEFNLGVSAELKRNNKEALRYYKEAQNHSSGDEEAANIRWAAIYDDIAGSVVFNTEDSVSGKTWFDRKIAVLPFSEETTSIDGPLLVQELVYEKLKSGGYNIIPKEDVARILAGHGFSEGGQFRATTPEEISEWLEADLLLFGHLEEFNKINVGVYVRKSIEGNFSLWDNLRKEERWKSAEPVFVQSIPTEASGEGILGHFLANLGESWIERAKNKPMFEEARQFVIDNIGTLPLRPKKS